MSKISRFSSIALAMTTGVWLSGFAMFVPVTQAQTTDLAAQLNALLAQVALLQAQLAAQGGSPAPAMAAFTQTLTLGSTGSEVMALQKFLNANGFKVSETGAGSPGNESTYFGAKTQAALAKYQAAKGITPSVGYFGPKTRAYINSLTVTPIDPNIPPVIPGTGLVITLAAGNPVAGMTVPKGATGVPVLKFNVSGNGTLDSLTFKRLGVGATADFGSGGMYLYEGSTRLTNGKTLNSTSHEVSFVNLGLQVAGTRTFTLVADISASATAGNRNSFTLTGMTGTPTPTGSVVGNEIAIGGQSAGGLNINDQNSPANPKIGEVQAALIEFKIAASSTEDIWVDRVSLTEGGSITNSYLSNFVLKQNGVTVATAQSIGTKDLLTLNFATPFKIEKGQNKAFVLYGDIAGGTRSADTIIFYIDSNSDVHAVGATYGYPVITDISGMNSTSNSTTLTVAGGDITITFNGPIAGNVPLRGQDVTLFDFTMASVNNIEVKNLRLNATTTGLSSGMGFNDFKLWDATNNSVISSATDVTTSTAVTVTDVFNVNAGQSKRYKVTADIDPDNSTTSTIVVSIQPWQGSDVRNLDNNSYVATSTIVPSGQVAGNTQTTVSPGLDVQLNGTPNSTTVVRGTTGAGLLGLSLRATNDDIKITSITLAASIVGTTSTISDLISDVQSLALYDGATKISDVKTLQGSSLPATAVFSNLNYTIKKGETKVLTLKGNISSVALNTTQYFAYLSATTNISAIDSQSNNVTITGSTANSAGTVVLTVASVGDVSVTNATQDSESKARLVIAGTREVLGKFKFTSQNEGMTVNKMSLMVSTSSATTTAGTGNTEGADQITTITLWDGTTGAQVGSTGGYSVIGSGASSGIALIDNLGWTLSKNEERTLVVKGDVKAIDISGSNGADSNTSVYLSILNSGFEAAGSTALDSSILSGTAAVGIGGVTSTEKLVVRGKPTVTWQALPSSQLTLNPVIARFRVAAGATPIQMKSFSFSVNPVLATITAPTTSNVTVYNITKAPSTALTLATVVSGGGTASTGAVALPLAGTSAGGYLTIYLTNAEEIAANSYNDFDVAVTLTSFSGTVGAANIQTKLSMAETASGGSSLQARTLAQVVASSSAATPASFSWSDMSRISHSESTADWLNGWLTELPVSTSWLIKN